VVTVFSCAFTYNNYLFLYNFQQKDTTRSRPIGFPLKQKSASIQSGLRKKTKGMFSLTVEKGIMGYGL
jgi:hypothetical protein